MASLLLMTEALIAEKPEKKAGGGTMPDMGDMGIQMSSHGRAGRVWGALRQILANLRRRSRSRADARLVDEQRARFWAEVREGEREAEARSGS